MRASRATSRVVGSVRARTTDRAQRLASESARVCFEDEWQPVRSRRCANERCARAKSNRSVAEISRGHDRHRFGRHVGRCYQE